MTPDIVPRDCAICGNGFVAREIAFSDSGSFGADNETETGVACPKCHAAFCFPSTFKSIKLHKKALSARRLG